jgi:hypothetical protein
MTINNRTRYIDREEGMDKSKRWMKILTRRRRGGENVCKMGAEHGVNLWDTLERH